MDGEGNRVLTCRFQIGPAALRRYFSLGKNGYDCRQATNTRRKNEAEARLFSSLPLTSEMGQTEKGSMRADVFRFAPELGH
jgi:hypothetical protein